MVWNSESTETLLEGLSDEGRGIDEIELARIIYVLGQETQKMDINTMMRRLDLPGQEISRVLNKNNFIDSGIIEVEMTQIGDEGSFSLTAANLTPQGREFCARLAKKSAEKSKERLARNPFQGVSHFWEERSSS